MTKISSEQKLALVRTIRMQSDYNRNQCRERERFLYGYPSAVKTHQREIYGAEVSSALNGGEKEIELCAKETPMLGSFRFRFVIAAILFGIFIYMDKTQTSLFEISTDEIVSYITADISFDL